MMLKTVMLTETATALVRMPQGAPVRTTARFEAWSSGEVSNELYWRQGVIGTKGTGPLMSASFRRPDCALEGVKVLGAFQLTRGGGAEPARTTDAREAMTRANVRR